MAFSISWAPNRAVFGDSAARISIRSHSTGLSANVFRIERA
ncbi:Uncharacterised protein [Mycobacterium tuberculosis]|nr:Uncharacterised protein [Mycobacterium tuberculosis]COW43456.1 Uncharacterised protein [Mycobacterium tuberculosis]COX61945.1 Uncharacterised protein [Mycobacterium tuberculosis]